MTFRHVTSSSRITRRSPHSRAHLRRALRATSDACDGVLRDVVARRGSGRRVGGEAARAWCRRPPLSGPPIARGSARGWRAAPRRRRSRAPARLPVPADRPSRRSRPRVSTPRPTSRTSPWTRERLRRHHPRRSFRRRRVQALPGGSPPLPRLPLVPRSTRRARAAGVQLGARFLLAFVFATIPAGIAAKTRVRRHPRQRRRPPRQRPRASSPSATFSSRTGSPPRSRRPPRVPRVPMVPIRRIHRHAGRPSTPRSNSPSSSPSPAGRVRALRRGERVGPRRVARLRREPTNALSLPTWAVHVSSVTEWSIATRLVWAHAETSGVRAWRGLSVAMLPFLASGFAACAFHLFTTRPR